jgi:hypothetical protein
MVERPCSKRGGGDLQPTLTVSHGEVGRADSKWEMRKSKSRRTATGKLEENLKWAGSFAEILERGQREFDQPRQAGCGRPRTRGKRWWYCGFAARDSGVACGERETRSALRIVETGRGAVGFARSSLPKPTIWSNILAISCSDLFL